MPSKTGELLCLSLEQKVKGTCKHLNVKKALFTANLLEIASLCVLHYQFQQLFLFTVTHIPLLKQIITVTDELVLLYKSSLMQVDL